MASPRGPVWRLVLPAAGHLAAAQLEVAGREAFGARPGGEVHATNGLHI